MKRLSFCLIIAVVIGAAHPACPQQRMGPFMAYGPETRHFANLNYSVYQSRNGYLWFGTSNGLVRFDGKQYKNFFSDHSNPNSPSGNTIVNFAEDKNDNLWMTDFGHGVTRYDPRTGTFKKYPRLSKDNHGYYGIYNVLCDAGKDLWFATAGRGLAKYDQARDSFDLFYPEPDKCKDGSVRGDNYVTSVCQDGEDKNILWCTSFHGLFSFDKRFRQFTKYDAGLVHPTGEGVMFKDAEMGEGSVLWLASFGKGLVQFNTVTKQFLTISDDAMPGSINDIQQISDSILYLACFDDGLIKYNTVKKKFENITPTNYSYEGKAANPGIQNISVTKNAGVFIGGNYFFYQEHPAFDRLKTNVLFGKERPSGNKFLTGIVWDANREKYWVTIQNGNGIYELPRRTNTLLPVKYSPVATAGRDAVFDNIIIDGKKRVWAVRYGEGLYGYDGTMELFTKATSAIVPDSLAVYVRKLATDKHGNTWAFAKDYFIYQDAAGTTELYKLEWDPGFTGLRTTGNAFLKTGYDNNAFLFTENGIFCCSRVTKKVIHIFKTGATKNSLASPSVRAATINRNNDLWLSSGSNLQVMHSSKFNILANHDIDHGLPTMAVNDLNTDSSGRIWANTSAGLAMFNPRAKYWRLYNRFDGIERDYLDLYSFITSDNKIAIDQVNGFILKDINDVMSSIQQPFLRITSILVNDSVYKTAVQAEQIKKISLSYKENSISIEYAAMDWLYPLQTTYVYWVEGLSAFRGNTVSPDARINFNGLAPGEYIVHLKAINHSGLWSNEVVLAIIVRPPFWMTAWFFIACILATGIILYSIYRYRLNQLKKIQDMRNNISQDLHDDIGASLSSINILNELAKRNAANPAKSIEYLERSGEDIQRISESMSDIVWNINPRYDDLQNLFIRMKRYAADMMDGKNIRYEMIFPDKPEKVSLSMEKRRDLYLVFKEAVNNLVKYSKAKNALISVKTASHTIELIVKDDGDGFDLQHARAGNGLQNMEQRARSSGATLHVRSQPGKGTIIGLNMKIS